MYLHVYICIYLRPISRLWQASDWKIIYKYFLRPLGIMGDRLSALLKTLRVSYLRNVPRGFRRSLNLPPMMPRDVREKLKNKINGINSNLNSRQKDLAFFLPFFSTLNGSLCKGKVSCLTH